MIVEVVPGAVVDIGIAKRALSALALKASTSRSFIFFISSATMSFFLFMSSAFSARCSSVQTMTWCVAGAMLAGGAMTAADGSSISMLSSPPPGPAVSPRDVSPPTSDDSALALAVDAVSISIVTGSGASPSFASSFAFFESFAKSVIHCQQNITTYTP
jgi:hypothetical protein